MPTHRIGLERSFQFLWNQLATKRAIQRSQLCRGVRRTHPDAHCLRPRLHKRLACSAARASPGSPGSPEGQVGASNHIYAPVRAPTASSGPAKRPHFAGVRACIHTKKMCAGACAVKVCLCECAAVEEGSSSFHGFSILQEWLF